MIGSSRFVRWARSVHLDDFTFTGAMYRLRDWSQSGVGLPHFVADYVAAPWVEQFEASTFAECPYYLDRSASCDRGCWDEPECVTCEPRGGWPDPPGPREVAVGLPGALRAGWGDYRAENGGGR